MLIDKLDLAIMEELEADVRQPVRALAKKLGVKRTTVRYRLNRLIDEGTLTISCVGNIESLGYQFLLVMGINTSSGKVETVGNQLVTLPAVQIVSLTAGRYNLMVWVLLRDRRALASFLSENVAAISDISTIEIMHSYQWIRDSWSYFKPQMETFNRCPREDPDDLDLAIIRAMQQAPRQTITKLAETVGCSKPVAKTRFEKLVSNGTIRFVSSVDPKALGRDIGVMILVKSKPDKVYDVAKELSAQNTAMSVSLITGQWQIFFGGQFQDSQQMHRFLSETLISIPGVIEFEVIYRVKNIKYSVDVLGRE